MEERLHIPPNRHRIGIQSPLVFLAGPIQGSPDWQNPTARTLLDHLDDDVHVASPRRESQEGFDWDEQVAWEKFHLLRSRTMGVIAFWFAARDHALEYEEGRDYAQTSRIELGRVAGWLDYSNFPVILGVDPEYSAQGGGNERYIRSLAAEHGIAVHISLDDVIDATIHEAL